MQTNEPQPSSSRNLVLNWDEHSATFFSRLRHLRSDLSLTDVTLSTSEGGEFRAHKLVLSVCSEYFDKIFVNNRSFNPQMTFATHSVVYLRDVTSKHVEMMLEYMYQGTVTVHEEELPGFLATANALKLRGLVHESNSNASTSDTRTRKRSNEYASEESGLPKTVKMEEIDLEVEDDKNLVLEDLDTNIHEEEVDDPGNLNYLEDDTLPHPDLTLNQVKDIGCKDILVSKQRPKDARL